ncbi:hypothetical protein A2U01_0011428 [Trifolium medium]|uniref:Uncharacterized protein n=1 Tax=Trifolium medium TaxID=97028 RepID=A0A392MTB8_9FABA|nr:hypothetical protein [Trifolium medium]
MGNNSWVIQDFLVVREDEIPSWNPRCQPVRTSGARACGCLYLLELPTRRVPEAMDAEVPQARSSLPFVFGVPRLAKLYCGARHLNCKTKEKTKSSLPPESDSQQPFGINELCAPHWLLVVVQKRISLTILPNVGRELPHEVYHEISGTQCSELLHSDQKF